MSVDVGPGTRLLCVECEEGDQLSVGTIYTCIEVSRDAEGHPCGLHGDDCPHAGVRVEGLRYVNDLREALFYFSSNAQIWHCLGAFRPIGGALPEEITRQLDSPFLTDTHFPFTPVNLPLIKEPA